MMSKKDFNQKNNKTSWEGSSKWYKNIVGEKGHYYHQHIILPNILRLLNLKSGEYLLDLACGQGILSRQIPNDVGYFGLDISPTLLDEAKKLNKNQKHLFLLTDASKDELPIRKTDVDKAAIILALQNIKKPFGVVKNASKHLRKNGKFLIVLNHPAFRIPQNSDWMVDNNKKLQSRKVDNYMSSLEIPILTNPGRGERSEKTFSYHHPISFYVEMLADNGFVVEMMEEWVSDKKSTGPMAEIEDKARREFPLFLAILARKV